MRSLHPFRDEARIRGLPEDEVERWLGTVRSCAGLSPAGGTPPHGPVAGQLGGTPPLPMDEPAPNLPFLASVDLAAIPADATDLPLPEAGTLLFFADTEDPWSGEEWYRLVYIPIGMPVSEPVPGADRPPRVHAAQDLHLTIEPTLPNRGEDTEQFPHGSELGSVWWDTWGDMRADAPVQIGGYPWVWNADPVTEHDYGPGDWVLLAEVGGDGLTDGDLVTVYWIIRRDDLANRRFARARARFDVSG
ncbi:DUF1963 domain-containing protein [Streptomyces sp. NPDC048179]|uniref:DUF1963 domain-containing protein n=1 Tax=Streptomyces sp. NPDC048179 TaxID=3365506 RepID=UPI00371AE672